MTPVSPFLWRSAIALIGGATIASLAVALVPGGYYDLIDLHLGEWRDHSVIVTLGGLVSGLFMAIFVFLIGKEAWEAVALEHAGFAGRQAGAPALAALGGMVGAALVWLALSALFETAEEAAGFPVWAAPLGADVVLAYLFARRIFGRGDPALQMLLFVTGLQLVLALVIAGIVSPVGVAFRPVWLLLPLAAALAGYLILTRPLRNPAVSERARARAEAILPWAGIALISWAGVAMSGLPPALGFLPVLPAMPHATRSFGLFAVAEGFLHDPANRLARMLLRALVVVLFLFGLTSGGLDFAATAPTTWIALGALLLGKPVGFLLAFWVAVKLLRLPAPRSLDALDYRLVAVLTAIGFTGPVLAMATVLPGGGMQEAARIGFALSLLVGPLALAVAARLR